MKRVKVSFIATVPEDEIDTLKDIVENDLKLLVDVDDYNDYIEELSDGEIEILE